MLEKRIDHISRTVMSLVVFLCVFTSAALAGAVDERGGVPEVYVPLLDRLVGEGFDEDILRRVFSDPRVEFLHRTLEINIKYVEKPEHYKRFVRPAYVKLGNEFVKRYAGFMKEVEARYGVPGEVVAAILLIESKLGEKRGKYRVFNVLATVATAGSESNIEANYKRLKERFPELDRGEVARRVKSRSRWAFEELKSLIRLARVEGMDLLEMKGSWAGAFGIPQFIPSSYMAYGVDGDGDGVRDLDNPYDAVASVANYLQRHGWKPGIDERQKRTVLWKYNHSELYVDAVLESARLIGGAGDGR